MGLLITWKDVYVEKLFENLFLKFQFRYLKNKSLRYQNSVDVIENYFHPNIQKHPKLMACVEKLNFFNIILGVHFPGFN